MPGLDLGTSLEATRAYVGHSFVRGHPVSTPPRNDGPRVRVFLDVLIKDVHRTGNEKGHMRRKSLHRLWTLILMLALCGASLAPSVRIAHASEIPTSDPLPSGGKPNAGDPDDPDSKSAPKPGASHGVVGQTVPQMQSGWGMWMLRFRMAFAAVSRFLFRF